MSWRLFGFEILSPREIQSRVNAPSPVAPTPDGSQTIYEHGGMTSQFFRTTVDLDPMAHGMSEQNLIAQYRALALNPEVDEALRHIITGMFITLDNVDPVSINTDDLPEEYDDEFRERVQEEFQHLMRVLRFKRDCHRIARQFYVDGKLYYDFIVDNDNPTKGIVDLRNVDPRRIRPVRVIRETPDDFTRIPLTEVVDEFFLYDPRGFLDYQSSFVTTASSVAIQGGVKITKSRIGYINSGRYTPGNTMVLSHLHQAIKPFNNLNMMEDAAVVYRISRAPERRVFNIDVGELMTPKAMAFASDLMNRYRSRMTYDASTGEVRDARHHQAITEDFWFPRRTSGRGVEVSTLPGGQNLGEMTDVEYFRHKLYKALRIPLTRLEQSSGYSLGRAAEITQQEVEFVKFLTELRTPFKDFFDQMMSRHLTMKRIIRRPDQWEELREWIDYEFVTDSHFYELKNLEMWNQRMMVVQMMAPAAENLVSEDWIKTNILKLTKDQQDAIDQDLEETGLETDMGDEGMGGMGGGGGMGGDMGGDMDAGDDTVPGDIPIGGDDEGGGEAPEPEIDTDVEG